MGGYLKNIKTVLFTFLLQNMHIC